MTLPIRVRAVTGAALMILAGCGTQPALPPAAEPRVVEQRAPADTRPVVVAFGDSLSAGFGVDPGLSYPDYLQHELDRLGLRYRVVNAGISGDTTSGGLTRLESVLAVQPRLVVLELGGNDGLRGLPVSATQSNLEQMIQAFQRARIPVVLAGITLPPNYGTGYIQDFEKVFTGLAKKYNVPLIPFLLEGVATVPGMMQQDGIHPTAEGNRKVAATVAKTVAPLLRK